MKKLIGLFILCLTLVSCASLSRLSTGSSSAPEEGRMVTPGFSGYSDMPVPSGTKMDVEKSFVLGDGDTWTGRLVLTNSDDIATIYDFYLREMPNYGWKHVTSVRAEISVLTFVRSNRVATITMQPGSISGTYITFTVSPRGEGVQPGGGTPPPSVPTSPFSSQQYR